MALREVAGLIAPRKAIERGNTVHLDHPVRPNDAKRLVYFAEMTGPSGTTDRTVQSLLERVNGNGHNRQSTRYSVHGLHEYKGKFNPQVAKAILNIFGIMPGQLALDPFCGSGTALVECAHLGVCSIGTDINPLAVFVANAKLNSLGIPAQKLRHETDLALACARRLRFELKGDDERSEYLTSWFSPEILLDIERLRAGIDASAGKMVAPVLLAIASNLLREYSLQEPHDLRIRRRKSPLPTTSFFQDFEDKAHAYCARLQNAQSVLGIVKPESKAVRIDIRHLGSEPALATTPFDIALTSPPYATALPYIDTQRLSLVWLGLLAPSGILDLDATLVGSREIRGQSKKDLLFALERNNAALPETETKFCLKLQKALSKEDGFRRQGVPRLLYRYFAGMASAFSSIRTVMKHDAPFALIVGGNHTILSGTRFDIDTPTHLANIAVSCGWHHLETVPLQTYQRYGLHMNNATNSEALVVLRA